MKCESAQNEDREESRLQSSHLVKTLEMISIFAS